MEHLKNHLLIRMRMRETVRLHFSLVFMLDYKRTKIWKFHKNIKYILTDLKNLILLRFFITIHNYI